MVIQNTNTKKYDIFISWANDDVEFVKNEEDLEGNKVDMKFTIGSYVAFKVSKYIQTVASNLTVYYSKNWKSGDWLNNLNEGLQQCRLFVFIITQQALDSKWMDYEFGASVALHSNVLDNKENFVLFNLTKVNRSKSIPATVGLQFCDLDVSGIEHFLDVLKRCFPECEFKNKPKLSVWENMYQKDVNDAISLINTSYVSNDDLRRDFNSIIDEKVNRINDLTKKLNNGNLHNKDIEELKKEVQSLSGNNGILTPNNNKFNKDVLKPASQTTDKTYKRAKILALSFGVLLLISLLCISLLKIKERNLIDTISEYETSLKKANDNNQELQKKYEQVLAEKEGYVDLGLPSGTLWATCNVGAQNPWDYGDYFAWGETKNKTSYTWDNYKYANKDAYKLTKYCYDKQYGNGGYTDTLSALEVKDDAAAAKNKNWRTPTVAEFDELKECCHWEWTQEHGVNGYVVTSKENSNRIFLPASGNKYGDKDTTFNIGRIGIYWLSSLSSDTKKEPYWAQGIYLENNKYDRYLWRRYLGYPIRPVRAEKITTKK